MLKLIRGAALTALFTFAALGFAAENVYLSLKANGNDIQGESTVTSQGRANTIECMAFEFAVEISRAGATATGRRTYEPIRFVKRIDKSTPLLYKALTQNEVVEGKFRFFRPSPTGDGTTQHFYTIEFKNGRIASVRNSVDNLSHPNQAPTEEVTIVFQSITWTYEIGGITHHDTASGGPASIVTTTRPPLAPTTRPRIPPPGEKEASESDQSRKD